MTTTSSELRALYLYQVGTHYTDIIEILADEYPELDTDQIDKIVNDAKEIFEEEKVRHEL